MIVVTGAASSSGSESLSSAGGFGASVVFGSGASAFSVTKTTLCNVTVDGAAAAFGVVGVGAGAAAASADLDSDGAAGDSAGSAAGAAGAGLAAAFTSAAFGATPPLPGSMMFGPSVIVTCCPFLVKTLTPPLEAVASPLKEEKEMKKARRKTTNMRRGKKPSFDEVKREGVGAILRCG